MDWSLFATLALAGGSVALLFGVILLIGVLGGQWTLKRQIVEARDAAELANDRITREVKRRAGQEGVEARSDAKSLETQAAEALAAAALPERTSRKPSTIASINAGKR